MNTRAHQDDGLQPERTLLAWRRTVLSLVGASVFFLRWVGHHGLFASSLVVLSLTAVLAIWFSQRRRYRISTLGIANDQLPAPCAEILALSLTAVAIGGLGLYVVLYF